MLEALCDHLLERPGLYLDEMALFLWDDFGTYITASSIRRALISINFLKKPSRQKAKERNADLRGFYLHNLSEFRSYHLVYINESGCDKWIGFRRTGWSPLGIVPIQISKFHHVNVCSVVSYLLHRKRLFRRGNRDWRFRSRVPDSGNRYEIGNGLYR